ncbi:MAG: hypothetical protein Q9204_008386, partial [Flavoplaca sp. TL-2023a]
VKTPNSTGDDVLGASQRSIKKSQSTSETHDSFTVNGNSQRRDLTNGTREASPLADEINHREGKRRRLANGDSGVTGIIDDHSKANSAVLIKSEVHAADDISEEGELEA